jgi:tRNA1(Val) A37 N6-methylase TrmN6
MLLYQPSNGYCYNSDSIFLYDFISSLKPKGKLLDVGCGVGIISLLLSRDFNVETTIIDKQEIMLRYAKHNFNINNISINGYLDDFIHFKYNEKFDIIISNPPFYDSRVTQTSNTNVNIARYAHHLPFDDFAKSVKRLLKPRGWFVFCYDAKQIDIILYTLKKYQINPEIIRFVHSKIDREAKLVMVASRTNSKSMTKILPPLVVFDENSNYLDEAKEAFLKADTHSIKADLKEDNDE